MKLVFLTLILLVLPLGAQERAPSALRISLHDDSASARSALFLVPATSAPRPTRSASASNDTSVTSTHGSRRAHMLMGFAVGAGLGWAGGRAIDHGQSHGCGGSEQSSPGRVCDYGSGYYEPVFAILGGLIGMGIASLLPHD